MGLAGADGEFPVTRAATELMHDLRRKKIHYDFPCFVASFIIESLFDLAKCRFWSGEATPGVRRPLFIRVRTAYSIAAT